VFGPSDGNDVLYEQNAKSLVASALDGFHATVFAYGITSSGKTYTMLGTPDNWGVIPRAVHDVLAHVAAHPERDWQLAVSYLELYNEKINDLLGDRANLDLREDPERGVFVADLTEVPVDTTQGIRGVLQLLALGECTHACTRACVRVCCVFVRACVCARVLACVHACLARAPFSRCRGISQRAGTLAPPT
jgi:centromeric protein E